MKLNEYLKLAYEKMLFAKRSWRIQVMHKVETPKTTPYYPIWDEIGHHFLDNTGERVDIEGDNTRPLIMWKDPITILPGDLPGVDSKIETQYGQWLVNVIGFTYPYSGKVPYIPTALAPAALHQAYIKAINDGTIQTRTELRKGVDGLEALIISDSEFGVKSSSSTLMDDDPEGDKLRKQMLKEYGDRIQDPVVQAEFDARLIAHKKTIVNKSGARDFYGNSSKLFGTVMMKTDGRYGSESDTAGNPTEFISKSLKEGVDMENTPSWINASRAGSFSRGALTALSGADVKEIIRALSSLTVTTNKDCGTKVGQRIAVDNSNYRLLTGVYLLGKEKDGAITEPNAKSFTGKTVVVRAPNGCLSKNLTYCQACMGTYIEPNAIALGVAELDSILMGIQMKAAHGYSKETSDLDLMRHCS